MHDSRSPVDFGLMTRFCPLTRGHVCVFAIIAQFGLMSSVWGEMNRCIGPGATTLVGGIAMSGSQLVTFLMGTRIYTPPPYVPLPIAFVCLSILTFLGQQILSSACFTAPVQHFPTSRGQVAALVKSFVGLGGAVVTESYVVLFGTPTPEPTAFNALLLWASCVISVTIAATLVMPRAVDPGANEPQGLLNMLFPTITLLGIFATVASLFKAVKEIHDILVVGMLLFALVPGFIILGGGGGSDDPERRAADARRPKGAAGFEAKDHRFVETIATLDAWLFVFTGVVVVGSGTVIATNISQIIESAGASGGLLPTCVTLFSTGNLLGRLLCMVPSDAFVRHGLPRPLFVALIAALAALAHGAFYAASALMEPSSSFQAAALVGGAGASGLAFGAQWPHFMVVTSELFGSKHLPTNYMFVDGMSGAFGTMLLANVIPSRIYAAASDGANDCQGPECFAPTHLIISALCISASVCAATLAYRSVPLYSQIASAMQLASQERELL